MTRGSSRCEGSMAADHWGQRRPYLGLIAGRVRGGAGWCRVLGSTGRLRPKPRSAVAVFGGAQTCGIMPPGVLPGRHSSAVEQLFRKSLAVCAVLACLEAQYKRAHVSAIRFGRSPDWERRCGPLASKPTLSSKSGGSGPTPECTRPVGRRLVSRGRSVVFGSR